MTDRILVVDDEKPVRETLSALLRQEGYDVVVAEGGHSAVEAIEVFTFDLVIVDIFMPGMNGLETIRVFRADAPDVPIIAMSGYASGSASSIRISSVPQWTMAPPAACASRSAASSCSTRLHSTAPRRPRWSRSGIMRLALSDIRQNTTHHRFEAPSRNCENRRFRRAL